MAKHYYYEYQDTITAILAEYSNSIRRTAQNRLSL